MEEGTGKKKIRRKDGDGKVRLGKHKAGAVRTLRLASFKHKNNTLKLCSQQPKMNFGDLHNYIRFYL